VGRGGMVAQEEEKDVREHHEKTDGAGL
jgi:hypothetical protein